MKLQIFHFFHKNVGITRQCVQQCQVQTLASHKYQKNRSEMIQSQAFVTSLIYNIIKNVTEILLYIGFSSGSYPGCFGILGCHEVVLRVPKNYGFSCHLMLFLMKLINRNHQGCL